MSGRKLNTPVPQATSAVSTSGKKQNESARETVEAIAIAFILAFVFKTFQAEAYVIPTGSMAPTLFGRHKEADCEMCRFRFTIGASQEINQESGIIERRVVSAECPNCRYLNDVKESPVFNGDRILVNKQVSEYRRFDVVVFKNPEEPHVNYIKRLVGLPGETVRVRQGDIYARKTNDDPWRIQRKEKPSVQKDIQLLVYDDRFPPEKLIEAGGEERWVPSALKTSPDGHASGNSADLSDVELLWQPVENEWKPDRLNRTYAFDGSDAKDPDTPLQWLRYRHLIPSNSQWTDAKNRGALETPLQASLIVDFCGFNAFSLKQGFAEHEIDDRGWFWVGDLTLNATVDIRSVSEDSLLALELAEGKRSYRCELNPASGKVSVFLTNRLIGGDDAPAELLSTVDSPVNGPGEYTIAFANVDKRLLLWVDGRIVPLGEKTEFHLSSPAEAAVDDLTPVGIAAGAMDVTVSDLVLQRDIYYRNETIDFSEDRGTTYDPIAGRDSWHQLEVPGQGLSELANTLHSPRAYSKRYLELTAEQQQQLGSRGEYQLDENEYLMFGDNSPASKDSRLFDYNTRPVQGRGGHRYAVQSQDLIGEALYIFWPHGIPFLNDGKGFSAMNHKADTKEGIVRVNYPMYRVPFYPNVSRMKKIR